MSEENNHPDRINELVAERDALLRLNKIMAETIAAYGRWARRLIDRGAIETHDLLNVCEVIQESEQLVAHCEALRETTPDKQNP